MILLLVLLVSNLYVFNVYFRIKKVALQSARPPHDSDDSVHNWRSTVSCRRRKNSLFD